VRISELWRTDSDDFFHPFGNPFDEICYCGATSVQVMRRMNALVSDLISVVPEERRPALNHWQQRLKSTIARSFPDSEERMEALKEDRQGLGAPLQHSSGSP
jgi:hypothetical protein